MDLSGDSGRAHEAHLDSMRTAGVVAILASHAIVPYMEHAPDWYVLDSQRWFVFDGLGLVSEAICIPLLLFVAGAVVPGSLARRGAASFLRARALRLLVPVPLGLATLVAMADWMRVCRHGGSVGFLEFWPRYWKWDLNHGHLWFLPYLFVLVASAALAARWRPKAFQAALSSAPQAPGWRALAAFALGLGLSKVALLMVTDDQTWVDTVLLNTQPSRVPFHVGFFLLGMASAFGRWREVPASRRRAKVATAIAIVAAAGQIIVAWLGRPPPGAVLRVADGLLHAAVSVGAVVMIREWARLRAKPPAGFGRSLQASSYGIYLVHYGPVLAYGLLLSGAPWHPVAKYLAVVAASLTTSWLAAEILIRIPGVRRVVG